jgi:hypothetical protein
VDGQQQSAVADAECIEWDGQWQCDADGGRNHQCGAAHGDGHHCGAERDGDASRGIRDVHGDADELERACGGWDAECVGDAVPQ